MFVRTRIAPSPTGEFHIGSLRTFLYDYALARKNGGQVVVRIEDTDRNRYVDGSEERMLDAIKAYGFDWDEGPRVGGPYGPYKQSERLPLYKKYAEELVAKGAAYYCFCTTARLEQLRKEQQAQGLAVTK
jgi:glutamyl/glutaminyl-tRNA synthetase